MDWSAGCHFHFQQKRKASKRNNFTRAGLQANDFCCFQRRSTSAPVGALRLTGCDLYPLMPRWGGKFSGPPGLRANCRKVGDGVALAPLHAVPRLSLPRRRCGCCLCSVFQPALWRSPCECAPLRGPCGRKLGRGRGSMELDGSLLGGSLTAVCRL